MKNLLSRLLDWLPLVIYGALFAAFLYVAIAGAGADSGGQVCSETGVADSVDYDC